MIARFKVLVTFQADLTLWRYVKNLNIEDKLNRALRSVKTGSLCLSLASLTMRLFKKALADLNSLKSVKLANNMQNSEN